MKHIEVHADLFEDFPIHADSDNCVGCNRCMRACPIETANIAYQATPDQIKVRIDPEQCVLCGACVDVCEHDARHIYDDTERFFKDLKAGKKISVIAAPAIRTNIPQWACLLTWLRGQGVCSIYDVSLGADLCVWAHLRHLEDSPGPIITQPCPVMVSYCERHQQSLLPYLSPVHSPMACTAIVMRRDGITDSIASLSPCVAKAEEHRATGLIQYNITFRKLEEYLKRHGVVMPDKKSGFDHHDAGFGALFPLPGGFKENIGLLSSRRIYVENAEGRDVFSHLDQYAKTDTQYLPDVFDVLNCTDGCLIGTGSDREQNLFRINKTMDAVRRGAVRNIEHSRAHLRRYDRLFHPEDFFRSYVAMAQKYEEVSEASIDKAFLMMKKDNFVKQNFNCGACGSDSCLSMARKIVNGVNIPSNCVIMSRDEAKSARRRNAKYLKLVRNIGDELFSMQDELESNVVQESLRVLSETIDCAAVAIWRRVGDKNSLKCERIHGWYGDNPDKVAICGELPEEWLARLKSGEHILINANIIPPGLFPGEVKMLFIVPIHIRGEFWGFVDAIDVKFRTFSEEEASLLESTGILLITGILERELNERLMIAREEALAGTRSKSEFLSRMSHEMRTPMNAIIGMAHMGKTANGPEQKDYCLDKINNASTHLLGVINDILDMSKIEANKFELYDITFDFKKMLQNVANFINFRVEEKRQIFTIDLDDGIPELLQGDDQRLAQVLTNLLANAVKFTQEEGRIRLSVRLLDEHEGDCRLCGEVNDTGIGISEEQQAHLFRSFEQAESGTSRKFGGTGLGLSISKRIVELMGGEVWIKSSLGSGSSFFFTFHMRRVADTDSTPARQAGIDGVRILVVDDKPEMLDFFRKLTGRLKVSCDTASGADEAMGMLEQCDEYNLFFIEYKLPDMGGVALSEKIRRQKGETPYIVLLSNMSPDDIQEQAAAVGVNRVLIKPLFSSSIMDVIHESLGCPQHPVEESLAEDDLSGLTGYRLMVVEDIAINREILLSLLEPAHMDITCAENGHMALALFRNNPDAYDLILMDLQMPEMDGYEATRQIRALKHPRAGEIPIIAMTANVFREDIEKCLETGMNDHLGKPIEHGEFVKKLRKYLSVR